ncbi:hypothetical protein [Halococcus saccharolyticus]|nr:hypothetical protein [Halococcus saccharolyticus]
MDDSVPAIAGVAGWWTGLDSGWQAVVLGWVLVVIVRAGVSIPW